jgi:hypothetical protein
MVLAPPLNAQAQIQTGVYQSDACLQQNGTSNINILSIGLPTFSHTPRQLRQTIDCQARYTLVSRKVPRS